MLTFIVSQYYMDLGDSEYIQISFKIRKFIEKNVRKESAMASDLSNLYGNFSNEPNQSKLLNFLRELIRILILLVSPKFNNLK